LVGLGTMLSYKPKIPGSFLDIIRLFKWPYPSSLIMALRYTQLLTEMSTRNLDGGKGRPASKADNHTANCKPIV
jgi:hypothetical protein